MLTGYTANLPTDCLLNAGVLFYTKGGSYVPIGVTDGAPDFDPGVELGEVMFDNRAPSRLKGLTRRVGFQAVFKGTLKEFGPSASGGQLQLLEPGSTEATVSTVTTETPQAAGSLYAVGAYLVDFRWIFERAGGGYAAIYAPLAIVRKWSAKGNDKKEGAIAFEIEAIGDPVNDLGTAPYTIELRTALPTGTPTTPSALMAQFNTLAGGGIGGTMSALFIRGINQTINANIASPTGFYCPAWDDAVNPGHGKGWTASSGFVNGAPCLATGEICGEGLELATSTGLCAGPADASGGTTLSDSPASSLADYLTDHAKGITWGEIARQAQDSTLFTLGEDAGGDFQWLYANESGNNWEPLADPLSAYTPGTSILHFAFWSLKNTSTTGPLSGTRQWAAHRAGRDLFRELTDPGDPTVARRLRLLHPRGTTQPNNSTSAVFAFYVLTGRASRAQSKMLNDWAGTQWSMYEDTRRIGIQYGDSYQDGYPIQNVSRGFNGAPHVPNFSMLTFAVGGNNVATFQYPKINWTIRDMDFSMRPAASVVVIASEYLNGGTLPQNYYWADKLRAEDAKIRVVMWNDTSVNNTLASSNNTDLDANAVAGGHASALIDFWRGVQNSLYNFSTGAPNKVPVLWIPSGTDPSQHPSTLLNEYWYAFFRNNILVALGDSDATRTMKIDSNVDNVSLSAGTPTNSPTWTPKSRSGTTLSKTLTFSSGNTGVATVNASTGLITRIAAGQTYAKAVSDDGGEGVIVVNCT